MSATYDEELPTDMDRARSLLGDTVVDPEESALHSNEHILAVLALQGSLATAAAWLADELAVRFAQQPGSVTLPSGLSVTWADRVKAWMALAIRLRAEGVGAASGASALSFVPATYGVAALADEFARPPEYWQE